MSAARAALRLLAERPAFELDQPVAGASWTLQVVEITQASRDALHETAG